PLREDGLDDELLAEANRQRDTTDVGEELPFETVEASATFDRVLYDGGEIGMHTEPGSATEVQFLGIPGLLEPEQVSALLRKRQAEQLAVERRRRTGDPRDDRTAAEDLASLRRQLNSLVGAWNHRTGKPHGVIHTELRAACGGP